MKGRCVDAYSKKTMGQEIEVQVRDRQAPGFEEWYTHTFGYWADWLERRVILDRVNPQEHDIILDAGCGTGRIARELARACEKVYALDFSPQSVDVLNTRAQHEGLSNIHSRAWDITQPFPVSEPVDKVISWEVVQHIPTAPQRQQALHNMYTQLRDGGTLVLAVYNWRPPYRRGELKEERSPSGLLCHRYTSAEAAAALNACGFKNVSIKGCVNFGVYSYLKNRLSNVQRLVAQCDLFFSKFDISRYRGSILVCTATK